ncbi:MAG: hypothetical protein QM626_03820, partial [Microbacterium sp.]|uniref:WxL protein peptidoglycan domain-containing protein n=1 Tax=Microbacterium sp. TaxID=51671 RepID=UPI0039E53211
MKTFLARLAAVVAVVAAAALFGAGTAQADDDGSVTWSVSPSDGTTADGRTWVELDMDPGTTVTQYMIITNLSDQAVTFTTYGADGYFTDTGRFNMLTSDAESTDAGTWIDIQDSVEVDGGASVVVPFTVTVPDNATPGDHAAGVAAAITSGSGTVGVESRVGFRVMVRVSGDLVTSVATTVTGVDYAGSINPFETGTLTVGYTVSNTGNTRVSVDPTVDVAGAFGIGATTVDGDTIAELAPGESRSGTVTIAHALPALFYSADVTATPAAVSADIPIADTVTPGTASGVGLAIPWSQLVTLLIAAALVAGFWWDRRRTRRRTERMIEQARAEARETVPGDSAGAPARTRRELSRAGVLTTALLLTGLAAAGVLALPADARADDYGDDGVTVNVEITASPTPTATASASPSSTGATAGDLATTGAPAMGGAVALGLGLVAVGALAVD